MSRSRLANTELDGPRHAARWRRIRRRIVAAHRRDRTQPHVPASMIPIDVVERGPCIRYPASIEDVRGVLDRLPAGTLDGLGSIAFHLSQPAPEHDAELDPYVGRLHRTIGPGVYTPETLGTYRFRDASIELFAYVYDPSSVRERSILETYLRVRMLHTLLHEVAHHRDFARRGRWRQSDEDTEGHAEAIAARWIRAHALPYLEETYPGELAELERWFVRHSGVALSIELLFGARDGGSYVLGATEGFEHLLSDVMVGEPIDADRLCTFAAYVHYDLHIEEALRIVEHVLAGDPVHAQAIRWRDHFWWHLAQAQ